MKKLLFFSAILLTCASLIIGCNAPTVTPVKPAAPATPTTPVIPTTPAITPVTTTTSTAPATTKPATPAKTAVPAGPIYGGTVRWIEPNPPGQPIGTLWEGPFMHPCMAMCFEPLLNGLVDGTFLPWMATSYELSADPKNPSVTFKLRKGVKLHDGTDYNAQLVKWNIQKIKDSGLSASARYYKTIEAKDDYTLAIELSEWRNSLMPAFARGQHYVVSREAFEKNGIDWLRWHMVGTGPFRQIDFQRDVSVTLVRNDDYWDKGKPYLEKIQYIFVADEMTRVALLRTGGAEVLNCASSGRVASELQSKGFNISSQVSGASCLFPDSNNADSPWANLKVRQAAEYAINKDEIAKAFGFGYWKAAPQVPSPAAPAYVPGIGDGRKYDPAKAKQLLTEAGFPNGFKNKIIAQSSANRDVVVALQSFLNTVGIQTDLDFVEPSKYTEVQNKGWNNGLLFVSWGLEGNINPSVGSNFPPVRTGRFMVVKNPPNWAEVYQASNTAPAVDPKLFQNEAKAIYDDVMVIPIYWETALYALNPKLQDHGLGTRNPGDWYPQNAWLSK